MKHEQKFRNKLEKFLADSVRRSQWITTPEVSVYVRKGVHRRGREVIKMLDLASIDVPQVLWGRGICTRVIEIMQEMSPFGSVYVENVSSIRLEIHLEKLRASDLRWQLETGFEGPGCWSWACTQVQKSGLHHQLAGQFSPEGWDA